MNRDQPTRVGSRAGGASTTPRGDVRALLALEALDHGIAKLEASAAAEFMNAQSFLRCPHCERVPFNPDWNERL